MIEWQSTKLGDVITLNYGKALKAENRIPGDFPVYSSAGLTGYHNESLVKSHGLIVGRKGTVGKVYYSKVPFCCIDTAYYVLPNETKYSLDYFYYLLQTLGLEELNEDSAVPGLNRETAYQQEFLLPSMSEQKAIASVLSSLDDKIDLLHCQNTTLEAMAETLFRQWFVEKAQADWITTKLGEILSCIESGSRPKGGIDPDLQFGIPSIGAENINGLGKYMHSKTKFITNEFFQSMKRGIIQDFDVLVYKDGAYVGRKAMFGKGYPFDVCSVNEHVFILRGNEKINQFFLYFLLQEEDLALLNTNSAQPGLNQESMKSFEILLPPINLINNFAEVVSPSINKIFENGTKIRTLEKLRDTLLPKLMSGEVRIQDD